VSQEEEEEEEVNSAYTNDIGATFTAVLADPLGPGRSIIDSRGFGELPNSAYCE
jgi:hypothetical protein